jgi:Holliday junction DNA helicase RuvB
LGKTTLANIVSKELGVNLNSTSGPVIERPVDLSAILSRLKDKEVLFVDEIHRLPHTVEEVLYPAMEDYKLDIVVGKGPSARAIKLELPRYTLIGATTRTGLITSPLRARFGMIIRIGFYSAEELAQIIKRSARILAIKIDEEGARELASRSRGTPRIANRLLRRVRDFAQVKGKGVITKDISAKALELLGIDEYGLDEMDKLLLKTLVEKFNGGPVGIKTLAIALGEEEDTLQEVCEAYLIQQGFLKRTAQGREATPLCYERLGIVDKKRSIQKKLWRG